MATGSPHKRGNRNPNLGYVVWGPEPGRGWDAGVGRKWAGRPGEGEWSPKFPRAENQTAVLSTSHIVTLAFFTTCRVYTVTIPLFS